jgi:hypothetical protein
MIPVKSPLNVVRTPEAEFTAVREKDPVTGKEENMDPIMLHVPIATSSWLEST